MKTVAAGIFRMKQFEIAQAGAAMKVNTDGLCLAAWAPMRTRGTILDIGSGTGLIALVIAQRFPQARIIGIEPHMPSFACMQRNFEQSPWKDRLKPVALDLQKFTESMLPGSLDGIMSNPPYFIHSSPPSTEGRLQARHMHKLTIPDLAGCAASLLAPHGSLSVIYPPDQMKAMTAACAMHGLKPVRRCLIRSKPGRNPVRVMQSFSFEAPDTLCEESFVIYNPDGSYSQTYRSFMKDFLTIF